MKLSKKLVFCLILLLISSFFLVDIKGAKANTSSPENKESVANLENPLGNIDSVPGIVGSIIKTTLGLVGSLALLAFVVGAGRWLISAGNSDQVKKGTQTMVYAAIGVFVVLASYGILNLVLDTFIGAGGG